ncbi:hypothetical protein AAG570_008921 [Ranatra chinensis]|uniref:Helicase ATP-binding domain-containing protein n=1 Tax=Ranatra chinensis TaxID=642074 RepID=A0ABD0YUG3_9HEMI
MQRSSKGRTTTTGENGERVKRCKSSTGCSMMKGVLSLGEEAIASIHDVEELTAKGKSLGSCPYYASRGAVPDAQVVVVPYNILLHKSTRDACGLKLDGNVVIIDEAHNLLDTIINIHSAQITGQQLTQAFSQLSQYKDKYEKRFSAINLLHLKQLIYVIGNLIKIIGKYYIVSNVF